MTGRSEPTNPGSGPGAKQPACDPKQGCPPGDLIVHVRKDSATGAPIQDAEVKISGPQSAAAKTDATDKAEFKSVKPGKYDIEARKDNHAPDPAKGSATVPAGGKAEATLVLKEKKIIRIKGKLEGTHGVRKPATDKRADNVLTSSASDVESLATNTPVILVRGCKDVELEAETSPPNLPVTWTVKANENTDAPPTITPIDGGKKAKLKTNVHGSFSVIGTLGSTKVVWNVVFVWVKVLTGTSKVKKRHNKYADNGSNAARTRFRSGQFSAGQYPWEASVSIKVVGGGNSKRLGTNKVKLHLLHNGVTDTLTAHYASPPAVNTALEVPKGGLPIRDSNGAGNPWMDNPTTVTPNNTDFKRKLWTGDSPAGSFPGTHKNNPQRITKIRGVNGFKAAIAAVSDDAPTALMVHAETSWQADFKGKVAATGQYTRDGAKTTADGKWKRISDATGGNDAGVAGFETFEPRFNGGTDTTWTP